MRAPHALPLVMALVSGLFQAPDDAGRYRQAVDEYRAGVTADAGIPVMAPSMAARAADPASGWTALDLTAAAMLHTDVLLRLAKARRFDDAGAHLDAGTSLLRAAVERDPSRRSYAHRWRTTVAGLLNAYEAAAIASRVRLDALPWLPLPPERVSASRYFDWGLAAEIRGAVAGPISGDAARRASPISSEGLGELRSAVESYQMALVADPAYAEASLHVGRIRLIEGRDAEANAALRLAAASDSVPTRYLATVFLGAVAERQSRIADAEAHYRAAIDIFPWGQSAAFALSHVLMRSGRESEARAALAAHFERTRGRVVEPFRLYLSDPETDLGPTLDLLRAEVWTR